MYILYEYIEDRYFFHWFTGWKNIFLFKLYIVEMLRTPYLKNHLTCEVNVPYIETWSDVSVLINLGLAMLNIARVIPLFLKMWHGRQGCSYLGNRFVKHLGISYVRIDSVFEYDDGWSQAGQRRLQFYKLSG